MPTDQTAESEAQAVTPLATEPVAPRKPFAKKAKAAVAVEKDSPKSLLDMVTGVLGELVPIGAPQAVSFRVAEDKFENLIIPLAESVSSSRAALEVRSFACDSGLSAAVVANRLGAAAKMAGDKIGAHADEWPDFRPDRKLCVLVWIE